MVLKREDGASEAGEEIRRREDLDTVFLRVHAILRIGARDHDAPVGEEDGFRVVEARDGGVGHNGHAGVGCEGGVVEDGVEVGLAAETESCDLVFVRSGIEERATRIAMCLHRDAPR